ncbi:MAG: bifunctional pyr operon transcriptional regulator/uracil phosphoribosyltransferase PyrR [Candidatus Omnitrophica bacterium]|nr:bifunctional pyr operon transcriptional regulator/uracil phosphoribosyltransferase PyrR [Candidatus Omnitrophota bacterium]
MTALPRSCLLTKEEIAKTLYRLACEVVEQHGKLNEVVLIGIHTRGVHLARRLRALIREREGIQLPLGILDITFYRDDLTAIGPKPVVRETKVDFDLQGKTVILVDDVLFTGRTVRAALDEIIDFGRPQRIELLVLVDRGHRELPVKADYVGKNIPTQRNAVVEVRVQEHDGADEVILKKR